MTHDTTPPATRTYCVWAGCHRRVYQYVEATGPEEAFRKAKDRPRDWVFCFEHEDNGYRLSADVQEAETQENFTVVPDKHRETRVSESGATSNADLFKNGERGPAPSLPTNAPLVVASDDTPPSDGPWTNERWAAARADSRWAAERWAAGMRERLHGYPTLHAEDKIRLAMAIFWDVVETWDHDTLGALSGGTAQLRRVSRGDWKQRVRHPVVPTGAFSPTRRWKRRVTTTNSPWPAPRWGTGSSRASRGRRSRS